MLGEPGIGFSDQRLVKPFLHNARLVARDKDNSPALRVERERNTPDPIVRRKPQLLHIAVLRASECIDVRAPQGGTVGAQQPASRASRTGEGSASYSGSNAAWLLTVHRIEDYNLRIIICREA